MLYSLLRSTTNTKSVNKEDLVKAVSKDNCSSLNDEIPVLPMRGHLQYSDFKKQDFHVGITMITGNGDHQAAQINEEIYDDVTAGVNDVIEEIYDDITVGVNDAMEEIYDDVVSATTPTIVKSAEHNQPATFSDQREKSTASQLTWQDKIETSDYMTLVRRPDDSETSDYMTIVRRPKDSETSDYNMALEGPENTYEPLTYYRLTSMPPPLASSQDEEFQSTENIYQPLNL